MYFFGFFLILYKLRHKFTKTNIFKTFLRDRDDINGFYGGIDMSLIFFKCPFNSL